MIMADNDKLSDKLNKMGRHFGRISQAPLKHQDSSDAWNERQNRLAAGRDSAKLLIRGAAQGQLEDDNTRPLEVGRDDVPVMGMTDDAIKRGVRNLMKLPRIAPQVGITEQMAGNVAHPQFPLAPANALPEDTDLSRFDDKLKNTAR